MGTGYQDKSETEMVDRTGQRALLPRGLPEDADEEWRPPKQPRALNACGHQGGGGGSPSSARLLHAARGWRGTPKNCRARS